MTFRADPEFDEDETPEAATPGSWAAAAAAVSVLIIATVTLTVVAGGWELSAALFG
ncbi:MAG TPA: hypothetical protein VEF55_03940 [Candidatus Binatia bacterium]|nr:hypothetical protein [Candidatus Binatia bacterium]